MDLCKCLAGVCKEAEQGFFHWCPVTAQEAQTKTQVSEPSGASGHQKAHFYSFQRGCRVPPYKASGFGRGQEALGGSCLSRGLEQGGYHRTLPLNYSLGFCALMSVMKPLSSALMPAGKDSDSR